MHLDTNTAARWTRSRSFKTIQFCLGLYELFDKLVLPILNYGCEVWGFHPGKAVERLHVHVQFWGYMMLSLYRTLKCILTLELYLICSWWSWLPPCLLHEARWWFCPSSLGIQDGYVFLHISFLSSIWCLQSLTKGVLLNFCSDIAFNTITKPWRHGYVTLC